MDALSKLRHHLRQQRQSIPPAQRAQFAQKVLSKVRHNLHCQPRQKIALYLPNDGEIDTQPIINFLKKRAISIYLPVLFGKKLKFAKLGHTFLKNRFGIDEPDDTAILSAHQMHTIFIPLVGFDHNKHRLGMGSGFYDRTLTFKQRQGRYQHPKLYGLAFDCQQVACLKAQPWDIPLNKIITPTTIYQ